MMSGHVILAFCWIMYGVLHSVLATMRVKNYFQKKWDKAYSYYRFAYNVIAFAGLIAVVWYQLSLPTIYLIQPPLLLQGVGAAIATAGLWLMAICIKKYFTGFSGLLNIRRKQIDTPLIISGVHRYVRHPLYLGTFVFIWGSWIAFPMLSLLISNTIITIYTLIGIELEEKKLVTDFGDSYEAYREKVPKIIPRILSDRKLPV